MRLTALLCCIGIASCSQAAGEFSPRQSQPRATGVAQAANGYKRIFTFDDTDGRDPEAPLVDVDGTLYGVTGAGPGLDGVFFKVTTSGSETPLYDFGSKPNDGIDPYYGPLVKVGNALYGTTAYGGTHNLGTVFTVTLSGRETVLHSFTGGKDGGLPRAGLTNVNGVLYGTTSSGGACGNGVCGAVFKITTSGKETVLYAFKGGTDGFGPAGGLTDVDGTLYGTTEYGGELSGDCPGSCGTVFKISLSGEERLIYRFGDTNQPDGIWPTSNLTNLDGVLYGTTLYGGTYASESAGTVFRITTSGSEKVIHSFRCDICSYLFSTTLLPVNGALYGTTAGRGPRFCGTIFKMTTAGAESVLYSFKGGKDGCGPIAGPTYVKGKLYGDTSGAVSQAAGR